MKLYRQPFSDFCAEWIEVIDVSTRLFDYLETISFGELEACPSKDCDATEQETQNRCTEEDSDFVPRKERKRRRKDVPETDIGQVKENSPKQIVSASTSKANAFKNTTENCKIPLISVDRYVARNVMLSSLVVAWSPVLQLSPKACSIPQNGSSISLLAVGGKSGEISFWRVSVPECYSVELIGDRTNALIVGLLQAHASWVTAISWALLDADCSNPRILLATGSSDGSVKIWLAYNDQLLKSNEANNAYFSLLKEFQ